MLARDLFHGCHGEITAVMALLQRSRHASAGIAASQMQGEHGNARGRYKLRPSMAGVAVKAASQIAWLSRHGVCAWNCCVTACAIKRQCVDARERNQPILPRSVMTGGRIGQ